MFINILFDKILITLCFLSIFKGIALFLERVLYKSINRELAYIEYF